MTTGGPTRGYTVRRQLAAQPNDVFPCFVERDGFAAWFVVPGFATPADRVVMDPRPGGRIAAVMVAEDGGDEVPFTLLYLHIDPDRSVRLEVGEDETVTIDLVAAAGGTALSYTYRGPETGPADVAAAEIMLDHLAHHVER